MLRSDYSYRNDPLVPAFADDKPVIVFDGECVFCSGWVQFVLKRDPQARYRFVAAQTPLGDALYRHYGLNRENYETNMVLDGGRAYFKSAATIHVAASLGFPWSLARVLTLIPAALLDPVYEVVARNRYRIAGRRTTCYAPTPEERGRFLTTDTLAETSDQPPAMPRSSASSALR